MKKYPLGTVIIYKELWKAVLAVKLWGDDCLIPIIKDMADDKYKIRSKCSLVSRWLTDDNLWDADTWQITIDTPEKQDWFLPHKADMISVMPALHRMEVDVPLPYILDEDVPINKLTEIERIIQRNNTPFPTPCEVIES